MAALLFYFISFPLIIYRHEQRKNPGHKSIRTHGTMIFQSRSNPSAVKVCFGPALNQLFVGQKPRNGLQRVKRPSLFSRSSVCRSFVDGVIFGGRRRPAKLHFRYALAECTVRQRKSYRIILDIGISPVVIVADIVVNPVTTIWCVITYCFIAGAVVIDISSAVCRYAVEH